MKKLRQIKFGECLQLFGSESLSSCLFFKNIKNEIWSFTEREEHRLRVFENRVLRRIFGSKREELTGGWRKLMRSFILLLK
jgi:hypothetical protein